MKSTKLLESFSGLEPELLERSERPRWGSRRRWAGFAAMAACAAILLAVAIPAGLGGGQRIKGPGLGPSGSTPDGQHQDPQPGADGPTQPEQKPSAEPDPTEDSGVLTPNEEEPPELIYNEMGAQPAVSPPAWLSDVTGRTPMSAWQLELVWSRDCPTAFLEEGDEERWYYDNNLSGTAEYFSDGTLYRMVLEFRERDWAVPVTVTVSPADGPLFTGCQPSDTVGLEPSFGSMGCYAYRYDYGDSVTLAAEFVIGQVRYRFTVSAAKEAEQEARNAVYSAVTRFQSNSVKDRYPDLASFVMGDCESGELASGGVRRLLRLLDRGDGTVVDVYRDGRAERLRLNEVDRTYLTLSNWNLSRKALLELRGLLGHMDSGPRYEGDSPRGRYLEFLAGLNGCPHCPTGEADYTVIPIDPWGMEAGEFSGCRDDNETIGRILELLEEMAD